MKHIFEIYLLVVFIGVCCGVYYNGAYPVSENTAAQCVVASIAP